MKTPDISLGNLNRSDIQKRDAEKNKKTEGGEKSTKRKIVEGVGIASSLAATALGSTEYALNKVHELEKKLENESKIHGESSHGEEQAKAKLRKELGIVSGGKDGIVDYDEEGNPVVIIDKNSIG